MSTVEMLSSVLKLKKKVFGCFPKICNKTKKPKYFFVKKQKQKTKWQINNLIFEQLVAMNSFFNI